MDDLEILRAIRLLLDHRYQIANRTKENDDYFENAYDSLKERIKDQAVFNTIIDGVNNKTLDSYKNSYSKNGYRITIEINKEESNDE